MDLLPLHIAQLVTADPHTNNANKSGAKRKVYMDTS